MDPNEFWLVSTGRYHRHLALSSQFPTTEDVRTLCKATLRNEKTRVLALELEDLTCPNCKALLTLLHPQPFPVPLIS